MAAGLSRFLLIVAAALSWAQPAVAQGTPPLERSQTEAIDVQHAAFARWLAALNAVQQPVQVMLAGVQGQVQAMMSASDFRAAAPGFRAALNRDLIVLDAVDARLAALDAPDLPLLELPEDLRPASIKRQVVAMNANIRTALQSFLPMLDALARRDLRAVEAASNRAMSAVRLMLVSQLLMVRAQQAGIPREMAGWHVMNIHVIYYRLMVQLLDAWPGMGPARTAPAVSREMLEAAAGLEEAVRIGEPRMEREISLMRAALADAERGGDQAAVRILRRSIAADVLVGEYFSVGRDFAAFLRREAPPLASRRQTIDDFVALLQRVYPFRNRMQEIEMRASTLPAQE